MKATKWIHWAIILVLMVTLLPAPQPAAAGAPAQDITPDTLFMPGEVVVAFEGEPGKIDTQAQANALAGEVAAAVVEISAESALLRFDPAQDVEALAEQLSGLEGVKYAEPNYIFWLPQPTTSAERPANVADIQRTTADGETHSVKIEHLQAMRSLRKVGSRIRAVPTYPVENTRGDIDHWGWWYSDAAMIWIERAASPLVCVVDTGVDLRHPDLSGMVINGFDFVNNISAQKDDNGHGTHVAGIISARINNREGLSGVSNGRVLAVKVLSAQGWGTVFDIAQGIRFCANNSAVRVINMSLGGTAADMVWEELDYAINAKGKLVVAAAGNGGTSDRDYAYPAAWSDDPTIGRGLIAVGAHNWDWERADFSNYGAWVTMYAPGQVIFSSLPTSYNFHKRYYEGWGFTPFGMRGVYDYLDGTSMAAPFVAGAAARAWSLFAAETNAAMKQRLIDGARDWAWTEEGAVKMLSVPAPMQRAAIYAYIHDAVTGLPLEGTLVTAHQAAAVRDRAIVSRHRAYVELINLPVAGAHYNIRASKGGYTAGAVTLASMHELDHGDWHSSPYLSVGIPPRGNITAVARWWGDNNDLYVFLPFAMSGVVGAGYSGHADDRGPGLLSEFPRARWNRDGGLDGADWLDLESISIAPRPGFPTMPFYNRTAADYYDFFLTDYGEEVDRGDGTMVRPLNDTLVFRVWVGGRPIVTFDKFDVCETGENWWWAGRMQYGSFIKEDRCGTGATEDEEFGGVWPYAEAGNAIWSTFER